DEDLPVVGAERVERLEEVLLGDATRFRLLRRSLDRLARNLPLQLLVLVERELPGVAPDMIDALVPQDAQQPHLEPRAVAQGRDRLVGLNEGLLSQVL